MSAGLFASITVTLLTEWVLVQIHTSEDSTCSFSCLCLSPSWNIIIYWTDVILLIGFSPVHAKIMKCEVLNYLSKHRKRLLQLSFIYTLSGATTLFSWKLESCDHIFLNFPPSKIYSCIHENPANNTGIVMRVFWKYIPDVSSGQWVYCESKLLHDSEGFLAQYGCLELVAEELCDSIYHEVLGLSITLSFWR